MHHKSKVIVTKSEFQNENRVVQIQFVFLLLLEPGYVRLQLLQYYKFALTDMSQGVLFTPLITAYLA